MDPFFQTVPAQPATPDAGQQPVASPDTETAVEGGVDLGAQFAKALLPNYSALIATAEPVTLLAIHAGFVLGHYIQQLLHKK